MKRLIPGLALLLLASGCPDNPTTEGPVTYHVAIEEPADGDEAVLADGEALEGGVESRDAVLAILKGIPSPPSDQPLKFEVTRTIDRPLFRDVDAADGPEHWITVAEVQDADGNVLWFDRVNSLFQLLEYLELVMSQQSSLSFSVNQVFSFVSMQYPSLLEFGVKVPTGIEGGVDYVLKLPKTDGEMYEGLRVPIADLVANVEEPSVTGDVVTHLDSGPPEDRVDIVILGDGYGAEEREKFELDAQAIAERLAATEPLATTAGSFNVHSVWTPSNEIGAGYDCTGVPTLDRGCKRDLRDTVFETVFVLTALADRFQIALQDTSDRVAMPVQVAKLYEAAAAVPFDEIIMVSNTRRRSGFAGLYISVLTSFDPRIDFPDVAVHEFGHSFGVLGDEYQVQGDPCLFNEPRIPLPTNIAATAERDELKWTHLVEEDTPLPTPRGTDVEVGAFQGAYNCPDLFRPRNVCKMRSSGDEFCAVCSEQMVSRIYSVVDPVAYEPTTAERSGDELVFTIPVRDEATQAVAWTMNDEPIEGGAQLRLTADQVPEVWSRLTATVTDGTGYVVDDHPRVRETRGWWVRR